MSDGTFHVKYPNTRCSECNELIHQGHRARFENRDGERLLLHVLCPGEREGTYRPAPPARRAANVARVREARRALGDS
jgi:hypothetical protein